MDNSISRFKGRVRDGARFLLFPMAVASEKDGNTSVAPKKGRGLSFEEKRKRLGEYFLEKVILEKSIHFLPIFVEGLFPIKRFGKDGPKGHWDCDAISKGSFTKFD